jgi:hypothetical protein
MTLKTIPLVLILSLLASCAQLPNQGTSEVRAPNKLAGLQAELTFLTWKSDLPDGSFPKTGQATHIYVTDTEFKTDGSKVNLPNAQGSYESTRLGDNQLKDSGFNKTFNGRYEIVYTFLTKTSGTFEEDWGNGAIYWTGTFEVSDI